MDILLLLCVNQTIQHKLGLPWKDRIHLIKNFIFPKFLFFFRPINIPPILLKRWQALLNIKRWQSFKSRLSHSGKWAKVYGTLEKSKTEKCNWYQAKMENLHPENLTNLYLNSSSEVAMKRNLVWMGWLELMLERWTPCWDLVTWDLGQLNDLHQPHPQVE